MAPRRDHSRDELHQLLLDAARRIVAEDGLAALTARRLAGAVGYSVGTVYNVFRNLDELILQLNADTLDKLHAFVSERYPRQGKPEDKLLTLADCYISFMQRYGHLWSALIEHRLPPGIDLPDWYVAKIHRLFQLIEDALAPLFPRTAARNRAEAAQLLWAAIHGICTLAQSDRLSVDGEEAAHSMARSLIVNYVEGLRSRKRAHRAG